MKVRLLPAVLAAALLWGSEAPGIAKADSEISEHGKKIVALTSGEPESLPYGADGASGANRVRFLATGDDTNGEWSLVELTEMPGTKTTWHRHNHTDQAYYVLAGVLTAKIAHTMYTLPAGSYIVIPRGTPHGHGNATKEPVRVLLTNTPAGFERYLKDRVDLLKRMTPKDPAFTKTMSELRKQHDAEELGVWEMK